MQAYIYYLDWFSSRGENKKYKFQQYINGEIFVAPAKKTFNAQNITSAIT